MSIADKLLQIAENQQKVYEAGYQNGTKLVEITTPSLDYVAGDLPCTISNVEKSFTKNSKVFCSCHDDVFPGCIVNKDGTWVGYVDEYLNYVEVQEIEKNGKKYLGFNISGSYYPYPGSDEQGNSQNFIKFWIYQNENNKDITIEQELIGEDTQSTGPYIFKIIF